MTHSPLQAFQRPTQAPSHALNHSDAGNNIGFPDAVSILADRRKGHADNSVFIGNFGDEIDVNGRCAAVEDDEPFIAIADFTNGFDHSIELRSVQRPIKEAAEAAE